MHRKQYRPTDRQATRESRQFAAFFRGHQDAKAGKLPTDCPFPDDSEAARGWHAGHRWLEAANEPA